jgi:hypothetical protein
MARCASRRALAGLLALGLGLACRAESPPRDDFPGMQLLARAEARLAHETAALQPLLDHYGLLFPVEPEALAAFMSHVRVHGDGPDLTLGTEFDPEAHGGGLLRMLFDQWRPEGRAPRLGDRYPFTGGALALERLYRAYQQQILLPGPEVPPGLPRMRFRFGLPGGRVRDVERDAYKFLSVLIELEPDRSQTWSNRAGQTLSVERLMANVRGHYLATAAPASDPPDHSTLHQVELLVAYGVELEPIQQHFLASDLAQRALAPADASFLLSHSAESLGHLLDAPALAWDADARRQVRRWLGALEQDHFRDVAAEDLESLCHLTVGLRVVRAHQAQLE